MVLGLRESHLVFLNIKEVTGKGCTFQAEISAQSRSLFELGEDVWLLYLSSEFIHFLFLSVVKVEFRQRMIF